MTQKKTILLTGAAGFIGFHTAQKLVERGDTVIGYDNFNNYYDPQLKRERVNILRKLGIEVLEGDICDSTALKELYAKHRFTHTLHLAAQAGVRYSFTNPDAYVASNLQGFVSILEACRLCPHSPFIYASSSSVYGGNKTIPFSVKDNTDQPVNLYGATKKANELMAYAYHHLYGIPMTGLRFFTVYGPWGRPDMAYYSFAQNIFAGNPISVFNHGRMKRDFTYIDDIVAGLLAALDLGAPWEIFNLGNHHPQELSYFISLLENAIGKKAVIDYQPMQQGEMEATYADIDHSKLAIGFTPSVSLEEGIPRFIQWYREYHKV